MAVGDLREFLIDTLTLEERYDTVLRRLYVDDDCTVERPKLSDRKRQALREEQDRLLDEFSRRRITGLVKRWKRHPELLNRMSQAMHRPRSTCTRSRSGRSPRLVVRRARRRARAPAGRQDDLSPSDLDARRAA